MPAATDRTITSTDGFVAEMGRIRDRGYAIDDGEQEVGVRCLAVPVQGGPAMMAVSISGPEARVSWDFVERAAPIVRRVALQLAGDLDHRD